MNKENKVISIAVGDRLHIEGVGTVELVVVAPEQNEQPKINKQEWIEAASRLFDSWMKISGGYVPKDGEKSFHVFYNRTKEKHCTDWWNHATMSSFNFQTLEQVEQFLSENEKDLKTFFHQV